METSILTIYILCLYLCIDVKCGLREIGWVRQCCNRNPEIQPFLFMRKKTLFSRWKLTRLFLENVPIMFHVCSNYRSVNDKTSLDQNMVDHFSSKKTNLCRKSWFSFDVWRKKLREDTLVHLSSPQICLFNVSDFSKTFWKALK